MRLATRILAWVAVGMLAMTALALTAMSWLLEPSIHTAQLGNLRGIGPTLDRLLDHEPQWLDEPDRLTALIGLPVQIVEGEDVPARHQLDLRSVRVALDHRALLLYFALSSNSRILRVGPVPEPPFHIAVQVLIVLVLALLASAAVTMALVRPILLRLRALRRTAEQISEGDLSARADEGGDDALGAVARSFNHMGERVQAVVRGQRELLQAVSHELRTPVARIRFDLELARTDDPLVRRDKLTAIEESAIELDQLIAELTEYVRFQSGPPPIRRCLVAVGDEVARAIARHRHLAPNVAMVAEIAPELEVAASPRHFRRVLDNLVSNAARHAASQLAIRANRCGHVVTLSVEDDGPGVPAADCQRIFEPFIRLDDSRARTRGGTGLGLALVARILAWHGGAIAVDDSALGGARFESRWPAPTGLSLQSDTNAYQTDLETREVAP